MNMKEIFKGLQKVLKRYMDMADQNYKIIPLWVLGTHFHKSFQTYPYLFVNATKGSGKTRLLKLISYFSKNGKVLALPSEAYTFRRADTTTFCMDEMEHLESKESKTLSLLLNTAYKKGLFIPRMDKDKKGEDGEMIAQEFETFAPICLANIYGLGAVLADRCISVILETSHTLEVTGKVEIWELEKDCRKLKEALDKINIVDISFFGITEIADLQYIPTIWNEVLENMRDDLPFDESFSIVQWNNYKIESSAELLKFLRMMYDVKIEGRDLELWLPLFFMAYMVGEDVLKDCIEIATNATEQKKVDEIGENVDNDLVAVLADFINGKSEIEYFNPNMIKTAMVEVIGEEKQNRDGSVVKESPYWLNVKWVGRALKRMNLIKQKRRRNTGVEFMLNFSKIKEKAKIIGYIIDTQTSITTLTTQTPQTAQTTLTTPENSVVSDDIVESVDTPATAVCYKCKGTNRLVQITDEITGEELWICEDCKKRDWATNRDKVYIDEEDEEND